MGVPLLLIVIFIWPFPINNHVWCLKKNQCELKKNHWKFKFNLTHSRRQFTYVYDLLLKTKMWHVNKFKIFIMELSVKLGSSFEVLANLKLFFMEICLMIKRILRWPSNWPFKI